MELGSEECRFWGGVRLELAHEAWSAITGRN